MDLVAMSNKERFEWMHKRHAFLHEIATQYSSLKTFASERNEWFAVRGIELTLCENFISLYIPLGCNEYETYHVITGNDGLLDISEVIWWQDPFCFNDVINIFTRESVGEEKILTSIHDYSHPVP